MEEEKLSFLVEKAMVMSFQNEDLLLALEKLTENERELILWIFVEGISLQQAATRAGITIPGIKKRRERLLHKLRENLQREIIFFSVPTCILQKITTENCKGHVHSIAKYITYSKMI